MSRQRDRAPWKSWELARDMGTTERMDAPLPRPERGLTMRKPVTVSPPRELPKLRTMHKPDGTVVHLPQSYKEENVIQLQPPHMEDTSDRSLVARSIDPRRMPAQTFSVPQRTLDLSTQRFDTAGFSQGDGLTKPMYYWSPFLTCSKCNSLIFVDTSNARSFNANAHPDAKAKMDLELLPSCQECGSTCDWWVGAHDLLKLIGSSRKELELLLKKQKVAVVVIQRAFRFYLRRMHGRAERHLKTIRNLLYYRAGTAINASARGRLGRRKAVCERAIRVIKNAHPDLLKAARFSKKYKRRVFWYKPDQVKIFYKDYILLCERTGFVPKRCQTEENAIEIARRIIEREAYLATRIQKRWRGISVRRFMVIYSMEYFRVREIRCTASFRIQRLFRGWSARRMIERLLVAKHKAARFKAYIKERFLEQEEKGKKYLAQKMRNRYSHERQQELVARGAGLVHPGQAGGKKMKAFQQSAYGDDAVTELMADHIGREVVTVHRNHDEDMKHSERGEYIRKRHEEGRSVQLYYKEEMRERSARLIEHFTKSRPLRSSASLIMQHNSTGIKFKYPEKIYIDPTYALYEGMDQLEGEGQNNVKKPKGMSRQKAALMEAKMKKMSQVKTSALDSALKVKSPKRANTTRNQITSGSDIILEEKR